jgi:hypothetical protein
MNIEDLRNRLCRKCFNVEHHGGQTENTEIK